MGNKRTTRKRRKNNWNQHVNPNKRLANRQKAKVSLITKATLSNNRAIRRLRGDKSKLMVSDYNEAASTSTNGIRGQWAQFTANHRGYIGGGLPTVPAILRPMYGMEKGDGNNQRSGSIVTLKSLTYKVHVKSTSQGTPGLGQNVGFFIVLDRNPTARCNLNGLLSGTNYGTNADSLMVSPFIVGVGTPPVLTAGMVPISLHYQNMTTCSDPNARYKVLRHHHKRVYNDVNSTTGGLSLKNEVNFSGTIKSAYKIVYQDEDTAAALSTTTFDPKQPQNQSIKFFFYSDAGLPGSPSNEPSFYVSCRYRYRDE